MHPNIVKVFQYTCDQASEDQCIRIYQDKTGWYYIHALVQVEGLRTPFSSIEEIASSQSLTGMKKVTDVDVPEELQQKIRDNWENLN